MNAASVLSIILATISFLGLVVVAVIQGRSNRSTTLMTVQSDRLDLTWQMQEKQIGRLEKQVEDLTVRATQAEGRSNMLDAELQECKKGRHQLELEVEILKMRQRDAGTS